MFSVPFVLANLVTAIYSAIGIMVVGRYTNPETIAAVATGSQIMNPVISVITGIGTGVTVLVGRCIGEKSAESGRKAVGSTFILSAVIIAALTLFMLCCREPLLDLLGTQPEARASASRFVYISTLGIPFNIGYGMISAVFRAIGNSKAPSIVAGISCAINIALSFLLVGAFGMAEAGVAIATVASQASSFILVAVWLYIVRLPFSFIKSDIRPDGKHMKSIVTVGLPIVIQELALTVAFMIITNRVNNISVQAAAAVGVVNRAVTIALVLPAAIGSAVSAMTAQNIGAAKRGRAIASLRWGITYSLIISVCVFAFCILRSRAVVSVFAADEGVIEAAISYLRTFSFETIMVSFVFCMNSYLAGCGKSKVAMIHTTISVFCVRVPLCVLISQLPGISLPTRLTYLGASGSVASLFSIIVCVIYIAMQQRKHRFAEEGVE